MGVWKVSFDFQFKMKVKIEKIVTFDFDPNIESRILFYFISFLFLFFLWGIVIMKNYL